MGGTYKKFKDPLYGYIEVPNTYIEHIIDSPEFQRLRRVIQTSYSPLFSSAVHNRFVHSLGVFHLGGVAWKYLRPLFVIKFKEHAIDIDIWGETFCLACLLHDVGHAPFSHIGEEFYLDEKENQRYTSLHKQLLSVVEDQEGLKKDLPGDSNAAAPHEIMSAIIGVTAFGKYFPKNGESDNTAVKEFFVRCITGYTFSEISELNCLKNMLISLLNGKVIDVDKLDYLIRDSYMTGFASVQIDYERLLSFISLHGDGVNSTLVYLKGAISVLENVVYAHDAERKWIQNHPVVLYENYILKYVISILKKKIEVVPEYKFFSVNSLMSSGEDFGGQLRVRLLCDDDIIHLMKQHLDNELVVQFFDRRKRKHPVWKSEAEYKASVLSIAEGGELLEKFENAMNSTAIYLTKYTDLWEINDAVLQRLLKEVESLDRLQGNNSIDKETIRVQKEDKKKILCVMDTIRKYATDCGIPYNFVLLPANQFNSGFGKNAFYDAKIVFDEYTIKTVGSITSSLSAKPSSRKMFFYLFYKRIDMKKIDGTKLCKKIMAALLQSAME